MKNNQGINNKNMKSILVLSLIPICFIFLTFIGLRYWTPDSWKPYEHEIKDFDEKTTEEILNTYKIALPNNAEIYSLEEKKSGQNILHILTINNVTNIDDFLDANPIVTHLMDVKEDDGLRKMETIKPICYYNNSKDKIYIVCYSLGKNNDPPELVEACNYSRAVEKLFIDLWQEQD